MNKLVIISIVLGLITYGSSVAQMPVAPAGPRAIVYKTKKDYSKLVSVLLSEDRKRIISYPDPADVKVNGKYPYPTKLHRGYLLDNRGIGTNTAYLNISYEKYAKLKSAPTLAELQKMIITTAPFTELCDCGPLSKFKQPVKQLNTLIDKKLLKADCKQVIP